MYVNGDVGLKGSKVEEQLTQLNNTGVKEVASLTISAVPTVAGNVTVTLNGVSTNIAVDPVIETTTNLVASKIRGTAFTGWTTGGIGSTVTFTSTTYGNKTDATYYAGGTGATGAMSTTTQGTDQKVTFVTNVEYIGIYNTDVTNAGVFTVNGIAITVPANDSAEFQIGGTPSPAVTVTGSTSYIVTRYV